ARVRIAEFVAGIEYGLRRTLADSIADLDAVPVEACAESGQPRWLVDDPEGTRARCFRMQRRIAAKGDIRAAKFTDVCRYTQRGATREGRCSRMTGQSARVFGEFARRDRTLEQIQHAWRTKALDPARAHQQVVQRLPAQPRLRIGRASEPRIVRPARRHMQIQLTRKGTPGQQRDFEFRVSFLDGI